MGSTISQYGSSTFGALATEAQKKEEENEQSPYPYSVPDERIQCPFTILPEDLC